MSLAVYLVKKETRSLSSVHVANRDPLIESRIYISLSPSLPPRSLAVDRGERLAWKLIFQNNCYSLCQGDSSVSKAFSYYSCWLSNLPAMGKYMRVAQPLARTIVKVAAWSKHNLWWVQRRGSKDLECLTSVTHKLKHKWHICVLICERLYLFFWLLPWGGVVGWAQADADDLLRMKRVLVSRLLCCCSVFTQTKPGYVHLHCAINVMEASWSRDSKLSCWWEM